MAESNFKESLMGCGYILLACVILFFALVKLEITLWILVIYSAILFILDIYYFTVGVHTKGIVSVRRTASSKFYDNDDYGFRRHPNVVAPQDPQGEVIDITVTYFTQRGRPDEERGYTIPASFWITESYDRAELNLFYLPWAPQKVRWLTIFGCIRHAFLPAMALYLFFLGVKF